MIEFILTGGTISSKGDSAKGVKPDVESFKIFLEKLDLDLRINQRQRIVFKEFSNCFSEDFDLDLLINLEKEIRSSKNQTIIIFHGTDTLSSTASYLKIRDLAQAFHKRIFITGAQKDFLRPGSEVEALYESILLLESLPFSVYVLMKKDLSNLLSIHSPFYVYKKESYSRISFYSRNQQELFLIKLKEKEIVELNEESFLEIKDQYRNQTIILDYRNDYPLTLLKNLSETYSVFLLRASGIGNLSLKFIEKLEEIKSKKYLVLDCPEGPCRNDVYERGRLLKEKGFITLPYSVDFAFHYCNSL